MEEMHREVLAHPAYSRDLAASDSQLTGSLNEALGGKRTGADYEVKLSVERRLEEQQTFLERGTMKLPEL
jgi:hypothetical protein